MTKDQRRLAQLRMPFGRYRDDTIATVWLDASYCEWLLSQNWFKRLFASHYAAVLLRPGTPQDAARIAEKLGAGRKSRIAAELQSRRDREATLQAEMIEDGRQRMETAEARTPQGIMPFGKYKGQPLNVVVLDWRYMAYLRGTQTYYRRNFGFDYYPNTMAQLCDLQGTIVPFPQRTKDRRRAFPIDRSV